ncbi:type III polyketide synthase [Bacillus taeanensis]|uniref:Type III polyketide synthase n=1 Tax=Bacillus taeanensis TaxID=273032 RepID=A0A366XXW8_9BACI|nr:3-oxoacyl-[acyl-carrier-protein] synthase III C-terminal domain-containing protein [Bacillus taeanensis]RBW70408.1 type III polyketide synthase [Bacillus taeanensis]
MSVILSVDTHSPPYKLSQQEVLSFIKELFKDSYTNIERLLPVFHNGQIEERYFSMPLEWFSKNHSFQEKNDLYIEHALTYSIEAITKCLNSSTFLIEPVSYEEIDAIFFISSTGMATPSIDARIMNILPFSKHTKRIPIWGLGCAGGAAGIARAHEYCLAYQHANVLVVSIELCSLTFQKDDLSKSNLVGTSLFADGAACALVVGRKSALLQRKKVSLLPAVKETQSTLMPHSEDVMGWNIKNGGLYVVFSKDIPSIIRSWLGENVKGFLQLYNLELQSIKHFVAHPGGRKVLEAYEETLSFSEEKTAISSHILKHYGNMSSTTVLFVLQKFMKTEEDKQKHDLGLLTALGPGFSSELVLLEWG